MPKGVSTTGKTWSRKPKFIKRFKAMLGEVAEMDKAIAELEKELEEKTRTIRKDLAMLRKAREIAAAEAGNLEEEQEPVAETPDDEDDTEDEEEAPASPPPKKRGRPFGSVNKPKETSPVRNGNGNGTHFAPHLSPPAATGLLEPIDVRGLASSGPIAGPAIELKQEVPQSPPISDRDPDEEPRRMQTIPSVDGSGRGEVKQWALQDAIEAVKSYLEVNGPTRSSQIARDLKIGGQTLTFIMRSPSFKCINSMTKEYGLVSQR